MKDYLFSGESLLQEWGAKLVDQLEGYLCLLENNLQNEDDLKQRQHEKLKWPKNKDNLKKDNIKNKYNLKT